MATSSATATTERQAPIASERKGFDAIRVLAREKKGLITTDVFRNSLVIALDDLKVRLQAHYESRFPGKGRLIREAIGEAEESAWSTQYPHLFLPDLVEEAMARFGASGTQEFGNQL